jgi:predicted benzoate:H+ symporter BenE
MDAWGFVLIIAAIVAYFLVRKSRPRLVILAALVGGFGAGIVFTSWYTVLVVMGGF